VSQLSPLLIQLTTRHPDSHITETIVAKAVKMYTCSMLLTTYTVHAQTDRLTDRQTNLLL